MKAAVIFDMDGVLVDSQPFHFEVDRVMLQRCGFPATVEHVKAFAGMATNDRVNKYKKDYHLDQTVAEMIVICEDVREELLKTAEFTAIDGVKALLQKLRERKIKTAVASSSSYAFIDLVLKAIGVSDDFDLIMSGEQMAHSKPAPDIFLAAAAKLGAAPEDCVVIEDSTNGVKAAFNARMKCVGYINASSGKQDLSTAAVIIRDFYELIDHDDWLA